MQRSCSLSCFLVQLREIRNVQKRVFFLSLSLALARGKCKLNSFCMFEESSQITRPSLRLSVFNCPSISGAVVVLRLLRWLSQSQTPSRDVEFDVAELEEPQTSAERCDLGYCSFSVMHLKKNLWTPTTTVILIKKRQNWFQAKAQIVC